MLWSKDVKTYNVSQAYGCLELEEPRTKISYTVKRRLQLGRGIRFNVTAIRYSILLQLICR